MNRFGYTFAILASSVLASACTDALTQTSSSGSTDDYGSTAGGSGDTYDHDNTQQISPWDLLNRLQTEGPPEVTAHLQSCKKVAYTTLANVLKGIGEDLSGTAATSAGQLYTNGAQAFGAPDYANRIRESVAISTSGMSRLYDIFAAAAPDIIATFANNTMDAPTVPRCPGVQLLNTATTPVTFTSDGLSCLLGLNATDSHLAAANLTIQNTDPSDPATLGPQLAVAAILAAGNTCE